MAAPIKGKRKAEEEITLPPPANNKPYKGTSATASASTIASAASGGSSAVAGQGLSSLFSMPRATLPGAASASASMATAVVAVVKRVPQTELQHFLWTYPGGDSAFALHVHTLAVIHFLEEVHKILPAAYHTWTWSHNKCFANSYLAKICEGVSFNVFTETSETSTFAAHIARYQSLTDLPRASDAFLRQQFSLPDVVEYIGDSNFPDEAERIITQFFPREDETFQTDEDLVPLILKKHQDAYHGAIGRILYLFRSIPMYVQSSSKMPMDLCNLVREYTYNHFEFHSNMFGSMCSIPWVMEEITRYTHKRTILMQLSVDTCDFDSNESEADVALSEASEIADTARNERLGKISDLFFERAILNGLLCYAKALQDPTITSKVVLARIDEYTRDRYSAMSDESNRRTMRSMLNDSSAVDHASWNRKQIEVGIEIDDEAPDAGSDAEGSDVTGVEGSDAGSDIEANNEAD
jgi:hypothetical protein